jgi:futalosine hydrolase
MEGAAVVHAARLAGLLAIEIRAISNTTGNRDAQQWDLGLALDNLGTAVNTAVSALQDE